MLALRFPRHFARLPMVTSRPAHLSSTTTDILGAPDISLPTPPLRSNAISSRCEPWRCTSGSTTCWTGSRHSHGCDANEPRSEPLPSGPTTPRCDRQAAGPIRDRPQLHGTASNGRLLIHRGDGGLRVTGRCRRRSPHRPTAQQARSRLLGPQRGVFVVARPLEVHASRRAPAGESA